MLSSRMILMGGREREREREREGGREGGISCRTGCTSRAQAGNLVSADFLAIN